MPNLKWKVWYFKASEEYELPCGVDAVRREREGGEYEYIAVCPVRISRLQAIQVFGSVRELDHARGDTTYWRIFKAQVLEFGAGFEQAETRPGTFTAPIIRTGRPTKK